MASRHAVVDGSNLATEGRTEPSLRQLDEAVRAFADEYDFSHITVIVDATFEHRVEARETKAARKAIDEGDIITPPAGVIGRGDAFILQVADKANAVVLSNDSFQEFHGTYAWLFDEGRLIGGKPVPGVGWIYVARSPVRGPVSRRSTAAAKRPARSVAKKSRAATKSQAVTKSRAATKSSAGRSPAPKKAASTTRKSGAEPSTDTASDAGSNKVAPWKQFQRDYPIGSTVAATIERFSSHGAYATLDGVTIYLPNRLLGEPAPSRARDVFEVGDTADFIVHRFDPDRRGIDAGLISVPGLEPVRSSARRAAKKASARTSKAAATKKKTIAEGASSKRAPAQRSSKKSRVAEKAAAKKPVAKKRVAKKPVAKKPVTKKASGRRRRAR